MIPGHVMDDEILPRDRTGQGPPPRAESYARIFLGPIGLLAALALVAAISLRPSPPPKPSPVPAPSPAPPPVVTSAVPEPAPVDLVGPPVPIVDPEAASLARSEVEGASRALSAAEARSDEVGKELEAIEAQLRAETRLRDEAEKLVDLPRARIVQARAILGDLKERKDQLDRVVVQLDGSPPPRIALNQDQSKFKSPVAREVKGEEFHFEIRGDRVTFLDLDRLLELAEKDARLRLRMSAPSRPIRATVGPVGAFSLQYELGPSPISGLGDLLGSVGSFTLLGFEAIPTHENRGETLETAILASSEFSRVMNRVQPGKTTITLWVYPDGFGLFRRLSPMLSRSGFFVAARPLPQEIPIRGSPTGSRSAAQ
jgi:hypothetical protein